MAERDYPLREIKKAKTRIRLYETGLTMMKSDKFADIMVDDLCRAAETSKVTFFKCFPQKEALLIYFMRVWLTERMLEIDESGKRGFGAVRHLLGSVADWHEEVPGVMPSLIAFLAQTDMHPCMPELGETEIHLLFPGREQEAAPSPDLHTLFRRSLLEAQEDGTLAAGLETEEATKLLWTVFYGAFLTARLYASADIRGFYELHLSLLEKN